MDKITSELLKRIEKLEHIIKEAEEKPYKCSVCGNPTDGYLRTMFLTRYYCKKHYPIAY